MTVNSESNRTSAVGSGSVGQTVPFTFPITQTSDMLVKKRITATGVESTLTESINYTISINSNLGGTLTTVTAIGTTEEIHLIRKIPFKQLLDLEQGDSFSAENIEGALDTNTKLTIQNKDKITYKALKFPETDSSSLTSELPSSVDRASKVLSFDSNGNATATSAVPTGSVSFSTFGTNMAEAANALAAKAVINLDHVIDVRDYGATGDGTTDDTSAIEDALAAGEVVYAPAGTYRLTSAVTIPNACTLIGDGVPSIDSSSQTIFYCDHNSDGFVIANTGTEQIRLSGFMLTKDGSDDTGTGNGIKRYGSTAGTGVQVDNVKINYFDTGLYIANGIMDNYSKISIRNCTSYGINLYGASTATGPHDCSFRDIWIYTTATGIHFNGYNMMHYFEHVKIMECSTIPINSTATVESRISFKGLMFENNNTAGSTALINIIGGSHWLFEDIYSAELTPLFSTTTDTSIASICVRNARVSDIGNGSGIMLENVYFEGVSQPDQVWSDGISLLSRTESVFVRSPYSVAGSLQGSNIITPTFQHGIIQTQYITSAGQSLDNAYWTNTGITLTDLQIDPYGTSKAYKLVNTDLDTEGNIYATVSYGASPADKTFTFQIWARPVSTTDCVLKVLLTHTASVYRQINFYLNRDEWTLCSVSLTCDDATPEDLICYLIVPSDNDNGVYLFEPCLYQSAIPLISQDASNTYIAGSYVTREYGNNRVSNDFGDLVFYENEIISYENEAIRS